MTFSKALTGPAEQVDPTGSAPPMQLVGSIPTGDEVVAGFGVVAGAHRLAAWELQALAEHVVGRPGALGPLACHELIRTRADLTRLSGYSALAVDTTGNPCVWRNLHACDCLEGPETEWESAWSCACDDTCPVCGVSCSPYESVWLGPADERLRTLWEALPEAGGEA
jgi:hypothetical protein